MGGNLSTENTFCFALHARRQLAVGQIIQIHRTFVSPGHVWQLAEHAVENHRMGFGQTVRQQVQAQVHIFGRCRFGLGVK